MYKKAGTNGEMHESTKQQTRVLRYLDTYTKYIIEVYAVNKREMAGAKATTEATTKGGGICTCEMNYIPLVTQGEGRRIPFELIVFLAYYIL